jgi:hypothetical protein
MGRYFITEMQTEWSTTFRNRLVFNAGKAYVRQLDAGENYHLLKPVYSLAILTDNFDHKTKNFYHHFQIVNRDNIKEIIPGLEFVLVELTEKFRPETLAYKKLRCLWLRFLKEVNEDLNTLPPEMQENKLISYAAELCEIGAYTPEELVRYDEYWDAVRYEKGIKAEYEEIGLEKGKAEGEAERLRLKNEAEAAQAKAEAERAEKEAAQAKAEAAQAKLKDSVLKSHRKGLSVETIADITGFTEDEITEILKHETYKNK